MEFIQTSEKLPNAQSLEGTAGTYYLIKIKHYGDCLAMYLKNEKGETGWYKDYTSKIIREVIAWVEVSTEQKPYLTIKQCINTK